MSQGADQVCILVPWTLSTWSPASDSLSSSSRYFRRWTRGLRKHEDQLLDPVPGPMGGNLSHPVLPRAAARRPGNWQAPPQPGLGLCDGNHIRSHFLSGEAGSACAASQGMLGSWEHEGGSEL